ncbi:MAG: heavy metal translocating P-type ATPase [Clostridium sp.]|uniref:heavy metal translocating P-type ATPase n=1 Tax=Clostridium sp. TaxID=1506 RepID=UPI002FCA4B23
MKKQFTVKGMTCASCAARVEKVVNKMDGVDEAVVNLATEKMTVNYDKDKIDTKDIEEKVKKAGYEADEIKSNDTVNESFKINGMTCASCSARIEKVLNKTEGIENAIVNLATEKATVTYDKGSISPKDIIDKVKKAGYDAEEIKESSNLSNAQFKVKGMTCASCAARIQKVVNKMEGVDDASVNLAAENMNVKYDSRKTSIDDIEKIVKKAGYEAVHITEDNKDDSKKEGEEKVKRARNRFIWSLIFAIPLITISMGSMLGLKLPDIIDPSVNPYNFAMIQLILTLIIIYVGREFFIHGFKNLFNLSPNMDTLIALGSTAALLYGIYALVKIGGGEVHFAHHLYFESAGMIVAFISLGKYLEALTKGKTSDAINKLMGLAPKTATIIIDGKEKVVPIEDVRVDDIIVVKPGERLPVDGVVVYGASAVDEAMLTGESIPVEKSIGSDVYGASINKTGMFKYKATKVGNDTVLSKIINLVEDAQGTKAPIAKLADVISGYFVPVVIVLSIISALAWYFIGNENLEFALNILISVLVIACPCALGLATPTAIMVSTGKGAENGVLIKSGVALEEAHKINTIIFDKTGTITEGKPKVTNIISISLDDLELLKITAAAEKGSEHPLGEAIVKAAEEKAIELPEIHNFDAIPGEGINTVIDGKAVSVGNRKMMTRNNIDISSLDDKAHVLAEEGKTPMFIGIDGNLAGVIAVADTVKENSAKTVNALHKMGIEVVMLTGDNERTAKAIAKQVGIDRVVSDVLPEGKANVVKEIQKEGKKVAMVGDGINDAPALVTAEIGIAIGSGTDVAIESADVVLMRSDLLDVVTAIQLSRATIKNIKENLFWAFGYNVLGIPVAMGILHIFGGPLLNPMIGAFAMSLSSVSVLLNALRLKGFKPKF